MLKATFSAPHPYSGKKIQGVPIAVDPWCWSCKERISQAS